MTEQDVLRRQETNGQTEFYLMLVGKFWHAYGNGAFALGRASGYRVVRKHRRHGDVLVCGFPMSCLEQVKCRISDKGGTVREIDERTYIFFGIDGTPDDGMVHDTPVAEPRQQVSEAAVTSVPPANDALRDELLAFNLSAATPIDAMIFLNQLQRKYGTQ